MAAAVPDDEGRCQVLVPPGESLAGPWAATDVATSQPPAHSAALCERIALPPQVYAVLLMCLAHHHGPGMLRHR